MGRGIHSFTTCPPQPRILSRVEPGALKQNNAEVHGESCLLPPRRPWSSICSPRRRHQAPGSGGSPGAQAIPVRVRWDPGCPGTGVHGRLAAALSSVSAVPVLQPTVRAACVKKRLGQGTVVPPLFPSTLLLTLLQSPTHSGLWDDHTVQTSRVHVPGHSRSPTECHLTAEGCHVGHGSKRQDQRLRLCPHRPPTPSLIPRTVVMGLEWSSLWPLIPSWPKPRTTRGAGEGQARFLDFEAWPSGLQVQLDRAALLGMICSGR